MYKTNTLSVCVMYYIDGLVQERRYSSALAMELRLSYTKPSIHEIFLDIFKPSMIWWITSTVDNFLGSFIECMATQNPLICGMKGQQPSATGKHWFEHIEAQMNYMYQYFADTISKCIFFERNCLYMYCHPNFT